MTEFISSLSDIFQYDFIFWALLMLILLSITSGLLSPIVVGKNYSFMGASISHASLLGISLSLSLLEVSEPITIFWLTLLITLLLSLFLAKSTLSQKIPADSLIGVFFTSSMALGLIVHSQSKNQSVDLLGYLFGNILLITQKDLFISLAITILVTFIILKKMHIWILYCLNLDIAKTQKVSIEFYHYLFFTLLTTCIISSLKMAGAILINSFLITPGLFSVLIAKSFKQGLLYSVFFALLTSISGLIFANFLNYPVGASIAVFQFTLLLLSKTISARMNK